MRLFSLFRNYADKRNIYLEIIICTVTRQDVFLSKRLDNYSLFRIDESLLLRLSISACDHQLYGHPSRQHCEKRVKECRVLRVIAINLHIEEINCHFKFIKFMLRTCSAIIVLFPVRLSVVGVSAFGVLQSETDGQTH